MELEESIERLREKTRMESKRVIVLSKDVEALLGEYDRLKERHDNPMVYVDFGTDPPIIHTIPIVTDERIPEGVAALIDTAPRCPYCNLTEFDGGDMQTCGSSYGRTRCWAWVHRPEAKP